MFFQVTEADSETLPSWLYFDDVSAAVEGIPSEADLGQYYVSVTAIGHKSNTSASSTEITEVFSISVSPEDITRPNSAIKEDGSEVSCPKEKVPAVASIILDADWSRLTAERRVAMVTKMSKYSMLKVSAFRLLPKGRKTNEDERVLITGPGNRPNGRFSGVSLSWKIGCGENAANLPVVTILETAAKDNSMAKEFGHDIIGWRVTGQKTKSKLRVRRQVNLAGTPMPTPDISVTPVMGSTTSRVPTVSVRTMVSTQVMTPTPTPAPTETSSMSFSPPTPSVSSTEMLTSMPSMTASVGMTTSMVPTSTIRPSMTPTTVTPTRVPVTTEPVNQPPVINEPINRIDAQEGVPLLFVVPADTFIDEDGDTRDLFLDVTDKSGMKLGKKSWLKFDKVNQMIHGLPSATFPGGKSRNTYIMEAQDSHGKYIRMPFEVVISKAEEEPQPAPVAMGAKLNIDFDDFMNDPLLQLDILNRIASIFGDSDASAITITGIKRGSVILSWTNNTIDKDSCPTDLINELMSKLINPDGTPTQALIDAFAPNYTISGVEAMEAGACTATTVAPTEADDTTKGGSTLKAAPGKKKGEGGSFILVPAIVIVCILLLAGLITLLLYRKHRKGKLSDEDNDTFINKGIPIILPDEIEEAEKPPPDTSSPLIMSNEKPPLPPPEYNSVQEGSREPLLNGNENPKVSSDEDDKNSLPMADIQKPDPPPQSTPPENRKQAPVNTPGYRVPPPYVPP